MDDFARRVREIVERNFGNEDFSIEQLCQEMGVSRTHLHRKLKAATDLSASLFIRQVRLENARQRLADSEDNISEIAYATGHKSHQNFSKYFTEAFGVSPTQYRKQIRQARAKLRAKQAPRPAHTRRFLSSRRSQIALVALIGLLALIGWWSWEQSAGSSPAAGVEDSASDIPALAVMPFRNYGTESDAFFSEGVVEDILTNLAQFDGIRVISRTSSARFNETEKSLQEIGAALAVGYILEGSVRQEGDRVRISAQLIRLRDENHIWAQRFDRPLQDVFAIQNEVANSIASALNRSINSSVYRQRDGAAAPQNVAAYTAVLRGRYFLRSRTEQDLDRAIEQFRRALAIEPEYAAAFVGLASAYQLLANLRYAPEQKQAQEELAEQYALKAIKNDRTNGSAYAILGNLYRDQYRWEESVSVYEIALDLSPNDAMINYWFSLSLRATGDLERALVYHQRASELDPLQPVIHAGHVYTCALAGEFARAEAILDKVKPIMSNSFLYYMVWGNLLARQGAYREAIPVLDKATELNPTFSYPESEKIYCLGRLGERERVLERIAQLDTTRALDCLRAAKYYLSIDADTMALRHLQQAAALGLVDDDLIAEPIYRRFRNHPDFIAILKQYNLYRFASRAEEDESFPIAKNEEATEQ